MIWISKSAFWTPNFAFKSTSAPSPATIQVGRGSRPDSFSSYNLSQILPCARTADQSTSTLHSRRQCPSNRWPPRRERPSNCFLSITRQDYAVNPPRRVLKASASSSSSLYSSYSLSSLPSKFRSFWAVGSGSFPASWGFLAQICWVNSWDLWKSELGLWIVQVTEDLKKDRSLLVGFLVWRWLRRRLIGVTDALVSLEFGLKIASCVRTARVASWRRLRPRRGRRITTVGFRRLRCTCWGTTGRIRSKVRI